MYGQDVTVARKQEIVAINSLQAALTHSMYLSVGQLEVASLD